MKKNTDFPPDPSQRESCSADLRVQILLEEYRALYGLLNFRLSATDRRLPTIGGALAAILGGTTAMPLLTQLMVLLGLPLALVWLVLTTAQHLRSKEDHLRRIDEIESLVNGLAGEELLVFQSRHPNKGRFPGGRTGLTAILTVVSGSLVMLSACGSLIHSAVVPSSEAEQAGYLAYLGTCAASMLASTIRLRGYRYRRSRSTQQPQFAATSEK